MDPLYYLYAFTWAGYPPGPSGPGVDPRFPVELVPCGRLAALASRVGLDQFDLAKLQRESTDVNWLSQIAVRHNQIIAEAAERSSVLPLRLGILFRSRTSLQAKVTRCESAVADFLRSLEDRQEWSAKVYLDRHLPEEALGLPGAVPSFPASGGGAGVQYLTRRRSRQQEQRILKLNRQREILAVETSLAGCADRYCRVRPLAASLTGRRQEMVWNAVFLLPRSSTAPWLAMAEERRRAVAPGGLLLEVSGPWPPYHFCPTLDM